MIKDVELSIHDERRRELIRLVLHSREDALLNDEALSQKLEGIQEFNDLPLQLLATAVLHYCYFYRSNARCALMPTTRYTLMPEATVIALCDINEGEVLNDMRGLLVPISTTEASYLETRCMTNSIILRKGREYLLAGPASKLNHECKNFVAKYVSYPSIGNFASICIQTTRHILKGEDITVSYSPNYFGQGNQDCRCLTCEQEGSNGWARTPSIARESVYSRTRGRTKAESLRRLKAKVFAYEGITPTPVRVRLDYHTLIPPDATSICEGCGFTIHRRVSSISWCLSCLEKRSLT